ncbi:hypothetical protein Dsin_008165 [Dipteronia sinensis]|uniref:Uncharacterized protein n=1 Tax=Dipteronia sinensis TaxID=43782 RepID=A0AAE0B2E4_9ROSI|nr:hypothetical protein Dsin_008165 [Dipteronia sinensis]
MVAKTMNGRQIRGWSIVSKIAAIGWEKRRSVLLKQSGSRMVDEEVYKVDGKVFDSKKGQQRKPAFAEVVNEHQIRGNKECLKVLEEGLSMSWDMADKEESWLSRCTIEFLKKI